MRTNIAAAAAERDPEAELKTAAEMLLQRGRAFAGSLLTDVSLGGLAREGPLCGWPGYRLPSAPGLLAIYVRSALGGPHRGPARPRGKEGPARADRLLRGGGPSHSLRIDLATAFFSATLAAANFEFTVPRGLAVSPQNSISTTLPRASQQILKGEKLSN